MRQEALVVMLRRMVQLNGQGIERGILCNTRSETRQNQTRAISKVPHFVYAARALRNPRGSL